MTDQSYDPTRESAVFRGLGGWPGKLVDLDSQQKRFLKEIRHVVKEELEKRLHANFSGAVPAGAASSFARKVTRGSRSCFEHRVGQEEEHRNSPPDALKQMRTVLDDIKTIRREIGLAQIDSSGDGAEQAEEKPRFEQLERECSTVSGQAESAQALGEKLKEEQLQRGLDIRKLQEENRVLLDHLGKAVAAEAAMKLELQGNISQRDLRIAEECGKRDATIVALQSKERATMERAMAAEARIQELHIACSQRDLTIRELQGERRASLRERPGGTEPKEHDLIKQEERFDPKVDELAHQHQKGIEELQPTPLQQDETITGLQGELRTIVSQLEASMGGAASLMAEIRALKETIPVFLGGVEDAKCLIQQATLDVGLINKATAEIDFDLNCKKIQEAAELDRNLVVDKIEAARVDVIEQLTSVFSSTIGFPVEIGLAGSQLQVAPAPQMASNCCGICSSECNIWVYQTPPYESGDGWLVSITAASGQRAEGAEPVRGTIRCGASALMHFQGNDSNNSVILDGSSMGPISLLRRRIGEHETGVCALADLKFDLIAPEGFTYRPIPQIAESHARTRKCVLPTLLKGSLLVGTFEA